MNSLCLLYCLDYDYTEIVSLMLDFVLFEEGYGTRE